MEELLNKYTHKGSFLFNKEDNLREKTKDVPNLPGVYIVYSFKNNKKLLVYIGKSGTICNNGTFKTQLLSKRLNNKQDGIRRQDYFLNKLVQEKIDYLEVQWFVTFNNQKQDIPAFVEGLLLQNYYNKHKILPLWNKGF